MSIEERTYKASVGGREVMVFLEDHYEVSFLVDGAAHRTSSEGKIAIWRFLLQCWSDILEYVPAEEQGKLFCIPQEWQGGPDDGVPRAKMYRRLGFQDTGQKVDIKINGVWKAIPCMNYVGK
jgi:hypothetical protein